MLRVKSFWRTPEETMPADRSVEANGRKMMLEDESFLGRRDVLGATGIAALLGAIGLPLAGTARAAGSSKLIWVPQALGDWDTAFQVGAKDFCNLAGWSYQRIGNPSYSVENHVESVNNAIAARPSVILTSLESPGLAPAFERGLDSGVTMVIVDQGVESEASRLGLGIINQDEFHAGILNGTEAARFAQKQTGKTSGMIVLGNGNPGSTSIDKRQNGSKLGVETYNKEHGTKYDFVAYPDGEFDELTASIQKWQAKFDQYGDDLVATVGTGNPIPIVQAMQERGMKPGQIACGSTDIPPAHQKAIADGWVQWGIDQQFYLMGFFGAAAGYARIQSTYPYPTIHTGGEVVTADNLKGVEERTALWVAKAKRYGFM
jgi:ABC-type sugar transport system substrate-binding protein